MSKAPESQLITKKIIKKTQHISERTQPLSLTQDQLRWSILSENAPQVLVNDTIKLEDLTLAWPQVVRERQRASQALAQRFYCQILYGCNNPRCKTVTCASCRKRITKRPFRRFTTLSARALAIQLASQDGAKKHLCPNRPVQINLVNEHDAPPRNHVPPPTEVDRIPIPDYWPARPLSPATKAAAGGDQAAQSDMQRISGTATTAENRSGSDLSTTKRKDQKSFAQSLFDTNTVEKFYNDPIPFHTVYFHSQEEQKVASEDQRVVEDVAKNPDQLARNDAGIKSDSRFKGRILSSREHLQRHDNPTVNFDTFNPRHSESSQCSKSNSEKLRPRQTLSHFSKQNVEALFAAVQHSRSEHPNTNHALREFPFLPLTSILAFASQSIAYVLSTPRALLASFRKDAIDAQTSTPIEATDFSYIVKALWWLKEIDFRLVMSSLLVTTKSLYTSSELLKRQNDLSDSNGSTANKNPAKSQQDSEELGVGHCRIMNEQEAAHLITIAFAALVATVPPCNSQTWYLVWQCHQSGLMVPNGVKDPATIRSVQIILDIFEDPLVLDLLSNLCEVIARRMFVARAERSGESDRYVDNDGIPENVMERFVSHLHKGRQCPYVYNVYDGETGFVRPGWWHGSRPYSSETGKKTDGEAGPEYLGIIAEWVRCFIIKNWDGGMNIDRHSAVGGALEVLRYISKHSHVALKNIF
ncbi:MAG: hypothetical protein Q9170_004833 [Blastenia crenularia]